MGSDKALIEVDGTPMAVRVHDALRAGGVEQVVCIGGNGVALTALNLDVVPDVHPAGGPLGGVCTALAAAGARGLDELVVAACDQFRLDGSVVATLLEVLARQASGSTAIVVAGADPFLAPLPMAALVTPVRPFADATFAAHDRSLRALLTKTGTVSVAGLDPASLIDADHPTDLPRRNMVLPADSDLPGRGPGPSRGSTKRASR